MSIIIKTYASEDENEIRQCLKTLKSTNANTFFMHESFNKDYPDNYTRSWFAWANTLFGELVIKLVRERPELMKKIF
jgi:meiotically up-regulated gene 157 (Mug157) protein